MIDSPEYLAKKRFFSSLITLYGRKVALEVLEDSSIEVYKLHLSISNKSDSILDKVIKIAKTRNIEIAYHSKAELSRISKNSSQDQGVAIDVVSKNYSHISTFRADSFKLMAVDGVNNPQNLGLIIRSVAASRFDGLILLGKNNTRLSPLVMKASAGTMFKLPIFYGSYEDLSVLDADIITLSSYADTSIESFKTPQKAIFVLGNESDGVSESVQKLSKHSLKIEMHRGVESLNVAVTAGIIAFLSH